MVIVRLSLSDDERFTWVDRTKFDDCIAFRPSMMAGL